MNKYGLHFMTWTEIQEQFKKNKVILIPMGSMEQHGSHSINGDFLAATHVAEKVAQKSNNLYLPTIPFGNSSYFKSFPGTISLREDTVTRIVKDIIENLTDHNQYKIVFLNGHAGNKSSITTAVRELKESIDELTVYTFNLWQTLTPEQKNGLYDTENDPSGHGSEPLSSIMRYLYSDYVDLSKSEFNRSKIQDDNVQILNLNQLNINGINVDGYYDMSDLSEDGIYSESFKPNAKTGENAINYIVDNICDALDNLF